MTRLFDIGPVPAAALIFAVGAAMLAGALAFQHLGDMAPCALCIEQRKAWGAAMALAFLAMLAGWKDWRQASLALLALAAVAALVGAGIAGFHVGVEQKWWAGTAECGAGFQGFQGGDIASLREQLLARPAVRCDEVPWAMFGISMAGWNGLIALATGLFGLYVSARNFRRRR